MNAIQEKVDVMIEDLNSIERAVLEEYLESNQCASSEMAEALKWIEQSRASLGFMVGYVEKFKIKMTECK